MTDRSSEELLFDNPEAIAQLFADVEDTLECNSVGEAELAWPGGLWICGPWPVCTCGGADNEVGHEYDCDCYP